jgi:hypothetical protein
MAIFLLTSFVSMRGKDFVSLKIYWTTDFNSWKGERTTYLIHHFLSKLLIQMHICPLGKPTETEYRQ